LNLLTRLVMSWRSAIDTGGAQRLQYLLFPFTPARNEQEMIPSALRSQNSGSMSCLEVRSRGLEVLQDGIPESQREHDLERPWCWMRPIGSAWQGW